MAATKQKPQDKVQKPAPTPSKPSGQKNQVPSRPTSRGK